MKSPRLIITLVCLAAFASGSSAQYQSVYSAYSFNNPMSASLHTMAWSSLNSRLIYKIGLRRKGYTDAQMNDMSTEELRVAYAGGKLPASSDLKTGGSNAGGLGTGRSAVATKPAANPASRFVPTKRRVLMPELVKSWSKDPAERKELLALFETSMVEVEKEASKSGFPNDVASSIAFYALATFSLHGDPEPPDEVQQMLILAVQNALDSKEVRMAKDLEKQKFYELMVTMGSYFMFAKQPLSGPEYESAFELLRQVADDVLMKFTGIDAAKVMLTKDGFVARPARS